MSITPEDQARVEEIAAGFKHILDQQFAMHLRVARRTTSVVRFGMISLAVVGLSMFLLLLTLAYQIQPMIGAVNTMNGHFTHISDNMLTMKDAILEMENNISPLPIMTGEMHRMQGSVRDLTGTTNSLSLRMDNLDTNLASVTQSVTRMTSSFAFINQTVGIMGADVNRMSGPMRVFNSMTPFK
jgi:hypothetical protein